MSVHMGLFPTIDWAWPILHQSIGSSQIETSNLWGCTDIYSRDSIQIHASNQKEPRSSPPSDYSTNSTSVSHRVCFHRGIFTYSTVPQVGNENATVNHG